MRVRLLGPVEILKDGKPVQLTGFGQRALVAALALEHGRVVSIGRLADLLWEGSPPASARNKIQIHVSALRRVLGQPARGMCGPLMTVGSSYRLCADCVRSDLAEFDDLMMRGRIALDGGDPGTASELFAAALALWRGHGCADLLSPGFRAAVRPVEERRVLTLEDKAEADLALGRPALVMAELSAWLSAVPLRERLRGLVMLAQYQLGCRADALSTYREGRRTMIAEAGLEPGPLLRDLHRRLLADDPALLRPGAAGFAFSRTAAG